MPRLSPGLRPCQLRLVEHDRRTVRLECESEGIQDLLIALPPVHRLVASHGPEHAGERRKQRLVDRLRYELVVVTPGEESQDDDEMIG